MKSGHTPFTSILRRLACVASPLVVCTLPLACVAGEETDLEEGMLGEATQALSGWYWYWSGTTRDLTGLPVSGLSTPDDPCALSGVAGNLSEGTATSPGLLSTARVGFNGLFTSLYAHGGATVNGSGARVWVDNPVKGAVTCFHGGTLVATATWTSTTGSGGSAPNPPVKIAGLHASNLRQCFLSGVTGSKTTWDGFPGNFVRVQKVTAPNASFPTAGWYIVSDMFHGWSADTLIEIEAECIDFPPGTVFTSGEEISFAGFTTIVDIATEPGTKACALTGLEGAFNQNSWTDGAVIEAPWNPPDVTWTLTVTNGKKARWACVE